MTDITMEGECAYAGWPHEKVRILCIDGPVGYPVLSMKDGDWVLRHKPNGVTQYHGEGFNLVPLKRKPREVWVRTYGDGIFGLGFHTDGEPGDDYVYVHFREVMPDDPA